MVQSSSGVDLVWARNTTQPVTMRSARSCLLGLVLSFVLYHTTAFPHFASLHDMIGANVGVNPRKDGRWRPYSASKPLPV